MVAKIRNLVQQAWSKLIRADLAEGHNVPGGNAVTVNQVVDCLAQHQAKQAMVPHTRVISYWSEGGHFFRWTYTAATLQRTYQHVAFLAEDTLVEFTWEDVRRVHEMMRFMELTIDCQDVVGW
jgi:hypothetical protein